MGIAHGKQTFRMCNRLLFRMTKLRCHLLRVRTRLYSLGTRGTSFSFKGMLSFQSLKRYIWYHCHRFLVDCNELIIKKWGREKGKSEVEKGKIMLSLYQVPSRNLCRNYVAKKNALLLIVVSHHRFAVSMSLCKEKLTDAWVLRLIIVSQVTSKHARLGHRSSLGEKIQWPVSKPHIFCCISLGFIAAHNHITSRHCLSSQGSVAAALCFDLLQSRQFSPGVTLGLPVGAWLEIEKMSIFKLCTNQGAQCIPRNNCQVASNHRSS